VRDSRLKETEGETRERERRGKWRERDRERVIDFFRRNRRKGYNFYKHFLPYCVLQFL
jgi:hypothetical protein